MCGTGLDQPLTPMSTGQDARDDRRTRPSTRLGARDGIPDHRDVPYVVDSEVQDRGEDHVGAGRPSPASSGQTA